MPPDVADVAEVAQQLADDRLGPAAVRALEVAVLDQRHRRVRGSTDMVAGRVLRALALPGVAADDLPEFI